MNRTKKMSGLARNGNNTSVRHGRAIRFLIAMAAVLLVATMASAQTARYLGSITAVNGDTLTVKTDAGDVHQVEVPSTAQLERVEPGQTDLSKAQPLEYGSLAVGDRVLVTIDPNFTGAPSHAARIIAIKKAEITQMQAAENAAWNQGFHGLVKSVDPSAGTIVVTMRMGAVSKDVTVTVAASTMLKRYAPGTITFDQAQPAPISAIQPGDQISARGTKSADGSSMTADAVVSGSFKSIPGTIISTDTAAKTVTVKDLASKKPMTVNITADSQLRRLDDNMATMLATRLKGDAGGGGRGQGGGRGGFQGGGPGGGRTMDLESMLNRAPQIQLDTLKKNDAVMIVATQDASGLSVVKLLAGVEPLLEAPEAQDLLSSWSLSSGEGGGEAQ